MTDAWKIEYKPEEFEIRPVAEVFIDDRYVLDHISLEQVGDYFNVLIGKSDCCPFGFDWFLRKSGISDPRVRDCFNSEWVGRYWEYLVYFNGTKAADVARAVLKEFWIWCHKNEYVLGEIPVDLDSSPALQPYSLSIKLRDLNARQVRRINFNCFQARDIIDQPPSIQQSDSPT